MKKTFVLALIAVPALLLSCTKEVENEVTRIVNFNAESIESKAVFGEKSGSTYPVKWSSNDVAPAVTMNYSDSYVQASDFTPSGDYTSATFSATATSDGSGSYTFLAVSPYSALRSVYTVLKRINVEIPSGQTSTASGPDENAIVLYAKSGSYTEFPDNVNLTFRHITAYLHLCFTNLSLSVGETVQSVNITSTKNIAGRMFYFPEDGTTEENAMLGTISVATTDVADVWVGLAPVDLSNTTLTLTVVTNQKEHSLDIALPSDRSLTSGKVKKMTIDMSSATSTDLTEYAMVTAASQLHVNDEVIVVAANFDYAMSTTQNSNNRGYTGITKDGNSIWSPSDAVQVITLVDGYKPGEYALKTGENAYLRFVSGGNYLRTGSTIDANASWDIQIADTDDTRDEVTGAKNIAFIQETTDGRYFRFNESLFSCYIASSGTSYVRLYRKVKDADTTPRFNVTLPGGTNVSSAAQTAYVYVFGNVDWTASVTGAGASLSSASGSGNAILTLSIPENADTENTKSYTVTVNTTAGVATQSFDFTITQAQAVDTSGDPVVVYSFTPNRTNNSNYGSNGSYAGNCDITIDGITWNVTGVTNSTSYDGWRLGGKSITSEGRAMYSKTAIAADVTKVVVAHAAFNITVNSFTLTVHNTAADAAAGTNAVATLTGAVSTSVPTEFVKADATSWAGKYYRLVYNVTNTSTTSNKYVQLSSLTVWGYPAD